MMFSLNFLAKPALLLALTGGNLALLIEAAPVAPAIGDKVNDRYVPLPFNAQTINCLLGDRMQTNLEARLLTVNTGPLLAGYVHRPGQQTWIGEHAAKFIDAATNTWAYAHNPKLKTKLDETVKTLLATQMPDGYLGRTRPNTAGPSGTYGRTNTT